ncbi:MAG: gliding motility protein GldM [Bacteroidales bacterium]|jgi:gliding motility-associated protein GldM|nr:gliding motility protein GldM [Bacteroidales bacterium]
MAHGKETPRQKMIGMMYLVLTAMLALNVSADILNAFVLVDNGLVKTTANFVAKNESAYGIFEAQMEKSAVKVGPYRDKAYSVRDMSDKLAYDIQELKVELIKHCDGPEAPSLTPVEWFVGVKREKKSTCDVNDALIQSKDNMDKPAQIMIVNGKGEELKKKIETYRDHLLSLTSDPSVQSAIKESLNTDAPPPAKDGTRQSWESSFFEHIPIVAVVTMLSKIQSDVRNAEADVVQNLLAQIGATDTKVNKMEAVVLTKSSYVLKGNEFEARIILAAYDSLQKPEIVLGPLRKTADGYEIAGEGRVLPYDAQGRAIYTNSPAVGNYMLQGLLRMTGAEGVMSYPFTYEYQVGEANTVISPTKMNVLYIGVDNPIAISVSGVPGDKISASMTNGSLTPSGGGWIAKPVSPGKAVVTVSAEIEGQKRKMGEMEFRVKTVPSPVAKVAGKIGGRIDKATLVAQIAVLADLENFEFDMKFTITEFTVTATKGQFVQNRATRGARISEEQKTLLNGLTKGSKVYFEDIKTQGPDGKIRELPSISFTID